MSRAHYIIGTRGSKLALIQTRQVVDLLRSFEPEAEFIVEIISSRGDIHSETPIHELGEKGLFTADLEAGLLEGRIDIAVHSAKDLPTEMTEGLSIAAYTQRIDPRDALVSQHGQKLAELPKGAVIGTSSPRRRYHLSACRGDLIFADIRGNVDTRIRKIHEGHYRGVVMACAGLIRMGLIGEVAEIFPLDVILPAAGQGALAVQCRHDDLRVFRLLELMNHEPTTRAVSAERAVLRILEAGCSWPIGVYAAFPESDTAERTRHLFLQASLYDETTKQFRKARSWGSPEHWHDLAEKVAEQLLG
jgi:hydroxymethylbilane synthase